MGYDYIYTINWYRYGEKTPHTTMSYLKFKHCEWATKKSDDPENFYVCIVKSLEHYDSNEYQSAVNNSKIADKDM